MAKHTPSIAGEDNEAITLRCTKCQANARFLKDADAKPITGGGWSVSSALQDKWLGPDCPVD